MHSHTKGRKHEEVQSIVPKIQFKTFSREAAKLPKAPPEKANE